MRLFPCHNALWLFYRAAFVSPSKQFDGLYNWLTSAVEALRRQTCLGIELFLQVAPISGGWESTEGGFALAPPSDTSMACGEIVVSKCWTK